MHADAALRRRVHQIEQSLNQPKTIPIYLDQFTYCPWEQVRGQVYLGSADWVATHQPDRVIEEVPRTQTQAQRPSLTQLFSGRRDRGRALVHAYRRYGYRLLEIAEHWGVHYATVSRHLKQAESDQV